MAPICTKPGPREAQTPSALPVSAARHPDMAGPRLAVVALTLTRFRNYARLRLGLDARPVVLTGPNGAGKTNLLEAVSYLGAGRGLRASRLQDVDRRPDGASADASAETSASWAVAARLAGAGGEFEIGTGRDPASAAPRRVVRIDGHAERGPAALAALVPVLWLTPAQDRLFTDQPGARRRFFDKLVAVLDPDHASRVNDYERALRERARLLREGGADPAWLAALERSMAETGTAIAAARRQAALDLSEAARAGIGPFPAARLEAAGDAEAWLSQGPAIDAEDRLAAALSECRARDGELGGAGAGPHRSDMAVVHAGRGTEAARMSTGEQKTLLLSILLAAARLQRRERGFAPLILLDEVAAHLDARHREALFDEVVALGAQAWMSGTDPALFAPLAGAAQFLSVASGAVAAAGSGPRNDQPSGTP